MNFQPFPTLQTKRLLLRRICMSDAPAVQILRSNTRVNQFLDRPRNVSLEDAEAHIGNVLGFEAEKKGVLWVLTLKTSGQFMGSIGFWNIEAAEDRAEIGYEMHPDFHGKGYMHEAIEAILAYGFLEMRLKSVLAHVQEENAASVRLLIKNGFVLEKGVFVQYSKFQ